MKQTTRRTRFVIFVGPHNSDRPCWYVKRDGGTTDVASLAVKFRTREEAKKFAQENEIDLNRDSYIEKEGFAELELQRQ